MTDSLIFSGRQPVDTLDPANRGFAYGDGLFETMRAVRGAVPWWRAHWTRLVDGCARLGIAVPDEGVASEAANGLLAGGDGVLKLVVTRGPGGRGYAPAGDAPPTWSLARHPAPPVSTAPIVLRWCHLRLAAQPALAGIKHCNRLEQVLARAEWAAAGADTTADEGLLLDAEGAVVSATAANLFVLRRGQWLTPPVDRCGVRGVCRGWVIPVLGAREQRLAPSDVESADAVFLTNAVRGILEGGRLGDREWSPHPQVADLRMRLAAANPAFIPSPESP